MSPDDVSALVESVTVIRTTVERQEHKERLRGVALVLTRIRLVTDRGYLLASGEGCGASYALRLAATSLERQVLEGKNRGKSKRRPDASEMAHLHGWWLDGRNALSAPCNSDNQKDCEPQNRLATILYGL